MDAYPKVDREYAALELSFGRIRRTGINFLVSYVLSRNTGNYPGLFNSDFNYPLPNANGSFDHPEMLENGSGLLPNDRTHGFKSWGSYRFGFGLTAGASFFWMSGTPLSEFGACPTAPAPFQCFLQQRGTNGRMANLWDLNLRLTYEPLGSSEARWQPRLTLDVFHIGNERTPVSYEQVHFFGRDEAGNQINPNPIYGLPTRYQPPMAVRLGLEVGF